MDAPLTGPGGKPDWALSRRERERAILRRHGLPPRRRWPWLLLVLALVAVAAAGAWAWRRQQAEAAPPEPAAVAEPAAAEAAEAAPGPVQINTNEWATVGPVTLRRTVKVIGPLDPARRADLSAQASGEVLVVAVRPGDAVAAGETLVQVDVDRLTLDLDLARANLDSTRAQLVLAQDQLTRAQELVDRGASAASTLDAPKGSVTTLQSSLAAQEDQVAVAELSLRGATVVAPFDGVVASRAVDPGAVVSPGTPLLSVVDLSEVEMVASAPVAESARIRPGQAVEVAIDGLDGASFAGEVTRLAPVAQEGTRTIAVYVRLANPDGRLRGGMFATGRIVIEEATGAIAIPEAGVLTDADGPYVLVIEGGALARRTIVAGPAWEGGLVQIASGLAPGDQVVTAALSGLTPGRPVHLVEF